MISNHSPFTLTGLGETMSQQREYVTEFNLDLCFHQ